MRYNPDEFRSNKFKDKQNLIYLSLYKPNENLGSSDRCVDV